MNDEEKKIQGAGESGRAEKIRKSGSEEERKSGGKDRMMNDEEKTVNQEQKKIRAEKKSNYSLLENERRLRG